jgi:methionyl-tRNA synthetase
VAENTFYLTTPIYYVNDIPHIGHAYTTVATDALARYKRLKGYEVLFLTGTDEHGQKVEKAATEAGLKPIELADKVVVRFQDLWKRLNISNDDFIRTTEKRHKRAVVSIWEEVEKSGDIYLGEYEDPYHRPAFPGQVPGLR